MKRSARSESFNVEPPLGGWRGGWVNG
ncbi:adenylate/guanylate cyclase [Streptomyces sp. CBMAI 2042]|nr:adenylate/guanylate cyclase [Streptomyces sp. CBMAI 2042]